MREDLSTRLNSSDTMELIREKEEQIRGLLEEGESHYCSSTSVPVHLLELTKRLLSDQQRKDARFGHNQKNTTKLN